MDNFEAWWHHEAIFMKRGMFEDNMEFTRRLCELAWLTATADTLNSVNDDLKPLKDFCGND